MQLLESEPLEPIPERPPGMVRVVLGCGGGRSFENPPIGRSEGETTHIGLIMRDTGRTAAVGEERDRTL